MPTPRPHPSVWRRASPRWLAFGVLAACTVSALVAFAAPSVHTRLPDAPPRFLYDGAGVLSGDERRAIEDTLMALDHGGIEIGVAIFKSIDGDAIEDVALALAEKWKPGNAERDNGALIAIAIEERSMHIAVGYGLEPVVTDAMAGRIVRYDMTPAFRAGRFGDGIALAVTNLARAARGEAIPEPKSTEAPPWLALLIVFVAIAIVIRIARANRHGWISGGGIRRGPWIGGGFGGFGGGGFGGGGGGGFGGGSFGGGSFGGGGASGRW